MSTHRFENSRIFHKQVRGVFSQRKIVQQPSKRNTTTTTTTTSKTTTSTHSTETFRVKFTEIFSPLQRR